MKHLFYKIISTIMIITMVAITTISFPAIAETTSKVQVFIQKGNNDCTVIRVIQNNTTKYCVIDLGGENCREFIANVVGSKTKSIDYLILTHYHGDHFNGINNLKSNGYMLTFKNVYANNVGKTCKVIDGKGNGLSTVESSIKEKIGNICTGTVNYISPKDKATFNIGTIKMNVFGSVFYRSETPNPNYEPQSITDINMIDSPTDTNVTSAANINSHSMFVAFLDNITDNRAGNIQYFFGGDLSPIGWNRVIKNYTTLAELLGVTSGNSDKVIYKSSHHGIRRQTFNETLVYDFLSKTSSTTRKKVDVLGCKVDVGENYYSSTNEYINIWKTKLGNNGSIIYYNKNELNSITASYELNKTVSVSDTVVGLYVSRGDLVKKLVFKNT